MYDIEKRKSGYLLTFSDYIEREEMQKWYDESKKVLVTENRNSFGVIVDMRELKPLAKEVQDLMVEGQGMYKAKGMQRSAVILNNPILTAQFRRLAKESGIYATERYVDASTVRDWSKVATEWVVNGNDPDA